MNTHTHSTTWNKAAKSFIAYQISKTNWGNKKCTHKEEQETQPKKERDEKEEKERTNPAKILIRNSDLDNTPEKPINVL